MKITELKRKLEEKRKTSSPSNALVEGPNSCSWNPMGEEAPFEAKLELVKSDEPDVYEPDEDDEQNFKEALSLLDTARDLLLASAKFMDARNLRLPGDLDWAVVVTCADIRQFLSAFDYQKLERKKEEKKEKKTTILGPTTSHECRHTRHEFCPLVKCACRCHAWEEGKGEKSEPANIETGFAPI